MVEVKRIPPKRLYGVNEKGKVVKMKGWQHVTFTATTAAGMVLSGTQYLKDIPAGPLSDAPPILFGAAFVAAIAGSLLPDIDNPESYLGRRFYGISRRFSRHRGITHSLGHFLIVSILLIALTILTPIPKPVAFSIYGLIYGYFTHLFLDMFSKMGIPVFWRKKKYGGKLLGCVDLWEKNKYIRFFPVKGFLSSVLLVVLIAISFEPLFIVTQTILSYIY